MHIPEGAEVLRVKVFPEASEDRVVEKGTHQYEIYTRAPALENQANREVLYLLGKHLGIDQKKLRLLSGHYSSSKLLLKSP